MTTQTQPTQNFFNLHTSGIGYLNNIREVTSKKGNPYISCNISALKGDSSNPAYTFFNVNVAGEQNEKLIQRCMSAVESNKTVLISFTLGDLWTEIFVYDKDSKYHKKGDIGVMLKARLIRIKSIKVDGKLVYQEESLEQKQHSAVAQQAAPQHQSEPVGDADFDNTPPQHTERQRPAYRQKQAQQPVQRQYPADSF